MGNTPRLFKTTEAIDSGQITAALKQDDTDALVAILFGACNAAMENVKIEMKAAGMIPDKSKPPVFMIHFEAVGIRGE